MGGASAAALPSGLWVAAYGDPGHLYRVDPETATVAVTADLGDLCCDLTEGAGLVWALERSGQVVGVDPSSGSVGVRMPVELDLNAHNNVVFAGGYVWVSSDTTALFRFDPATGRRSELDVGGGVPFLARRRVASGAPRRPSSGRWTPGPARSSGGSPCRTRLEVMALAIESDDGVGRPAPPGRRRPPSSSSTSRRARCAAKCRSTSRAPIELAFGSVWVSDSGSSMVLRINP